MDGYDLYFSSGGYERRYPAPNRATLALVEGLIGGERRRVLDFGCGSGRYAVPLAVHTPASLVGYDPCTTALSLLRQRAERAGAEARIQTVSGSLEDLRRDTTADPFDLALILFGVLGHIRHRSERIRHLHAVRSLLKSDGRLVVSVPNALRRFRREQEAPWTDQGAREPGDILYERKLGRERVRLFYHLYRPGELEAELTEAGFEPLSMRAESVLPEWLIARRPVAAAVDAALRAVLPIRFAYGFLAVSGRGG
ncbi:MAG: class I SAM-dependent methyltransferase [Geminicoccaceae bacterium]